MMHCHDMDGYEESGILSVYRVHALEGVSSFFLVDIPNAVLLHGFVMPVYICIMDLSDVYLLSGVYKDIVNIIP